MCKHVVAVLVSVLHDASAAVQQCLPMAGLIADLDAADLRDARSAGGAAGRCRSDRAAG